MPFWRTAEFVFESGCSRMVARGQKLFHDGQVEVSVRIRQTSVEGASIKIELPMWRTASAAAMLGDERVEFVGSVIVEGGIVLE